MSRRPPRLPERFVRAAVPRDRAEAHLGDLEECYRSEGRGSLWYWRQCLSVALAYRLEAWRRRRDRRRVRRGKDGPMKGLLADLRFGVRTLGREPGVTTIAVLVLALGIGSTTAIFSIVHSVLLRPLPYAQPDALVRVYETKPTGELESLSPPNFFDWRESNDVFAGMAAYWSPDVNLTGAGEPEKVLAATSTFNLFSVLGVEPILGRGFALEDDLPGAKQVIVLSHSLWRRRFASDPTVLGQEVRLDGMEMEIVGVMPAGFDYPQSGTELWVPLRLPRERAPQGGLTYRGFRILNVVARLKEGVSIDEARGQLGTLATRLQEAHPDSNAGYSSAVVALHTATFGPVRAPLLVLLAAVVALLLMTCANVGSIFLTRAASRRRELAVRTAMGASRARITTQLLGESLFVAFVGGALGVVVAAAGVRLLPVLMPGNVPRLGDASVNLPVLVFAVAITFLSGVLFGGVPSLRAPRQKLSEALQVGRSDTGASGARTREVFVVVEVALALLLLIVTSLLVQSLQRLQRVDTGIRDAQLSYGRVELPFSNYRDRARRVDYFRDFLARLRSEPGIARASVSLGLPLDPRAEFFVTRSAFEAEGQPPAARGQKPEAGLQVVGDDFFDVLGVELLRGRAFRNDDDDATPAVVLVNEAFVRAHWPDQDPVGRRLTHDLALTPGDATERIVVGVVSDFRYYDLTRPPEPQMFVPHAQMPWPQMHVLIESSLAPGAQQSALRRVMSELDADVPAPPLRPLSGVREGVVAEPRFRARLLGLFSVLAVCLAAVGLYGVTAYSVAQRTPEIGLRMALGATRSNALGLVLSHSFKLVSTGVVLGLGGAWLATRLLESLLFGVGAMDPRTFLLVPLVLAGLGLLACLSPAWRAARVDPLVSLRGAL